MNTKEYNAGQKVKCAYDREEFTLTAKEAKWANSRPKSANVAWKCLWCQTRGIISLKLAVKYAKKIGIEVKDLGKVANYENLKRLFGSDCWDPACKDQDNFKQREKFVKLQEEWRKEARAKTLKKLEGKYREGKKDFTGNGAIIKVGKW